MPTSIFILNNIHDKIRVDHLLRQVLLILVEHALLRGLGVVVPWSLARVASPQNFLSLLRAKVILLPEL